MRNKIPDAINSSVAKDFTQIPNDLFRKHPELSFKAKGILCTLLSNREGWHSYIETLKQMAKEGDTALRAGLQELEAAGYLKRIKFREKRTKQYKGQFWAYTDTPGKHNLEETLSMLDDEGFEICENPTERAINRKPIDGQPSPNNTNYNKSKEVRNRISKKPEILSGTTKPFSLNKLVRTSHKNSCKFTPENFFPFLPEEWRDEVLLCSALGKYLTGREKKGKPLNMKQIESHSKFLVDNSGGDLLTAIRLVKKSTKRGLNGFWPLRREWWMDKDGNPNMSDPDVRQFMAARGFYPDDEQRDEDIYHPEEGEGK